MFFLSSLSLSKFIHGILILAGIVAENATIQVIEAPTLDYTDYHENHDTIKLPNLKNVLYDPDTDLSPPDMIKRAGYPAEAHVVETEDGYLLTLHRIPNQSGHPVFIQHGLLSSSADWLIAGRNKALAYLLADQGFDVWLGNSRGNTYSRAHVNLSPEDSKFWDFTFHEMGIFDLPAVITYITNYKNESLTYIGHSMGTTMSFIMASERPCMQKQVRMMFSLAPVAYMTHIKSPIRIFAPYVRDLEIMKKIFGLNELLPQDWIVKLLSRYGCSINTAEEEICANIMFALCGFDSSQFNLTLLPIITSHSPAGASTKTVIHYLQEVTSGRFRQYDYGEKTNMKLYNTTSPPDYDITKIRIPVYFFYSDNDWLAAVQDVERFYQQLPLAMGIQRVSLPQFNHLDFLWGIDAPKLVYNELIDLVQSIHQKYYIYN